MRSREEIAAVLELVEAGLNDCAIARRTGVPRSTVRTWRAGGLPGERWRILAARANPANVPPQHYSYLLGMYLGDGHLVHVHRGVFRLTIALDQRYPAIISDCAAAVGSVSGKTPSLVPQPGCIRVNAYWKQWPVLFPQHGPGRKHLRPIVLVDWQQAIVDAHPKPFLRGLIQSDGCRSMNRVTVNSKQYAYPRYTFSNASDDIRRLFCEACEAIGIEWRRMNARNISVARRASVARLDEFIGPKA